MRRNGGGASATVGAAEAQKKPGNLRCRVSTRERDRLAGFPADGADYLREALVAPLTASSALAWTLAVVDSTWALAIWAMASLAFRVRTNTSWPVLRARSTFSRAPCAPFGSAAFSPSDRKTAGKGQRGSGRVTLGGVGARRK